MEAQRGLRGGYVLARAVDELTILDVVNSVDPLQRIEACPLGLRGHGEGLCALHRRLDEGIAQVESLFRSMTIERLLRDPGPHLNPLCEPKPSLATANVADGESSEASW